MNDQHVCLCVCNLILLLNKEQTKKFCGNQSIHVRKQEPKINAQEQELKKQNENRNEIAHERKNHNNNMRVGVEKQKNMENKFHGSIALNPNVLVDIVC